jgi:hypothetical protein
VKQCGAFDFVMVAPGCPSHASTWAGLLGVDVGPHSFWAFLVLLIGGLGAKLITLSHPEIPEFQDVNRKKI